MSAFRVVEKFDVVKDVAPCFFSIGVDFPANPLALEQLEEALCHGIVVAVSPPAHAGDQIVRLQECEVPPKIEPRAF